MKNGNICIFKFKFTKYNYSQLKLPLGYSVKNSFSITCIKNSSGVITAEFRSLWKNITFINKDLSIPFFRGKSISLQNYKFLCPLAF